MIEADSQANQPASSWQSLWHRIVRLLRNSVFRALVSAQLIAALVIVVRGYGWLRPMELAAYAILRVVGTKPAPADDVVLVGMTEADIRRWQYPLNDDFLAALLYRIASWHPRAIGVDLYRDMPV